MTSKAELISLLHGLLDDRIAQARAEIASANVSKENESKSSAGDKYETGMAMLQMEEAQHQAQLAKHKRMKSELSSIAESPASTVVIGSLVLTDKATYFISIPVGNITIDGQDVFCISLASPIGQALKGATKGDSITFNETAMKIEQIL